MNNLVRELIFYDKISFRYWFSKETVSKVIVIFLFILLALGISLTLFFVSFGFFKYLFTLEGYGQLTGIYIIRASLLVVLWLGVLSSLISTITFLLTPDKRIDYIFTQPVSTTGIVVYQILKTLLLNTVIFAVILLPLSMSYLINLHVPVVFGLIRSFVVLILTAIITESFGSAVGYIVATRVKRKEGLFFVLTTILLVITLTVVLFKIIFPVQLNLLYSANTSDFSTVFSQLPLNKFCQVNNSLSSIIFNGLNASTIILLAFTVFLAIVAYQIQTLLFNDAWQQVRIIVGQHLPVFKISPRSLKYPSLFQKDVISVLRSPKDVAYGIFLFALILAFIGLFSRGIEVNRIPTRFASSITVFSWLWLLFYSITYFMRISFPLMSKEGKTRWWLFTIPVGVDKIINSKLSSSMIFSIPLFLIIFLEWWFSPVKASPVFLSIFSLISVIFLAIEITLVGIIRPDYSLPDDPDKASTSISGIFALTVSIMASVFTGYLLYLSLGDRNLEALSVIALTVVTSLILFSLYYLSFRSQKIHSIEVR